MSGPTLQEQIDAANAYEALMVPALFGQWATKVADAAHIRPGQRVLDVACGTGVLGRELASRVGRAGIVAGLDPSPGMLEVAKQLAPAVEWRQGIAESLPFPDESFDAVVSQFGLMFFSDRRKALAEALRVLVPSGRLAVAVWDSLDNITAYAAEVALLERFAGQPAADALRAPFDSVIDAILPPCLRMPESDRSKSSPTAARHGFRAFGSWLRLISGVGCL